MAYPPITAIPTPPNRLTDSPTEFSNNTDAFLSALPQFRIDVNGFGDWVEARSVTLENYVDLKKSETQQLVADAEAQVALAKTQADNAAESASDAESFSQIAINNANFKGLWSEQTGSATPPCAVYHSGRYWQLLTPLDDVTTSEPSVSSDWAVSATVSGRTIVDSDMTLDFAGRYFIDGSYNVTFPDPAGLADGTRYDLLWAIGFEPTLLTVTDGFVSERWATNEILCDRRAITELTVYNNKYEV